MNDPNGLVLHAGEYHLFYQHNPLGDVWGDIGWGHAVSRDLVSWEELPVAIPALGDEMVFSGSAVMDGERMVAIYTSAREGRQVQCLACSSDRGRTFTRFAGNPVLDIGLSDFRDPKVFAWEGGWVMAVALSLERTIRFFRSPDLVTWSFAGDFTWALDGVWECPDVFRLDGRWVLIVSVEPRVWYWVGDFDGSTFVASTEPRLVDHGPDFYAAQTWDGEVLIAWMNHWAHARSRGGRSFMTVPRRLSLRGDVLIQQPVVPLAGEVLRDGELEEVFADGGALVRSTVWRP
jgi:sucrose-6-phosphate hydrolase SacC (GH32 family)